jgi:outer membrane protein assembly factor BamA
MGSLTYAQRWREDRRTSQEVAASYEIRASADGLGSDVRYTRHLGHARYEFDSRHNDIIADVFVGGITGEAPLFERFTLGDSSTLRGWNKYDIAPAGGNRVVHQSIEYRFHGFALFLDAGSVWNDAGTKRELRSSTGFGFHIDNFFATAAFPLDAHGAGGTFLMGVRF